MSGNKQKKDLKYYYKTHKIPKMKTVICSLIVSCFLLTSVIGQQFRTTLSEKREYTLKLIDIEADLEIDTHSGNEIVIQATSLPGTPDKAKGLRPLTKSGIDNTGIGLNMEIIDDIIVFTGGKSNNDLKYEIKIPKNINLNINNPGFARMYDISLTGISKEIEIVISNGNIMMENITGPVIARTGKGNVDIIFSKISQEGPMSVICETGDIDLTIQSNEKVTFKLSAGKGDIYTDLDLKEAENTLGSLGWYNFVTPKSGSNNFYYGFDDKNLNRFYIPDRGKISIDKDGLMEIEEKFDESDIEKILEENKNTWKNYSDAQKYYSRSLALSHPLFYYDFFFYDFKGDLNGGGVEIAMKTEDGNIYLRQAK